MRATDWAIQTDIETVKKRNAGRRHFNAVRKFRASLRRVKVTELALEMQGLFTDWGLQTRIARRLGVSRSTICRDFQAIMALCRQGKPCPLCGHKVIHF